MKGNAAINVCTIIEYMGVNTSGVESTLFIHIYTVFACIWYGSNIRLNDGIQRSHARNFVYGVLALSVNACLIHFKPVSPLNLPTKLLST